jgi:hypothetical protein
MTARTDEATISKIREMRRRGSTYRCIAAVLHISTATVALHLDEQQPDDISWPTSPWEQRAQELKRVSRR